MTNHIDQKVIIITGGASGFGRLVAQKTAALGAKVMVADVNQDGLTETCSLIKAEGGIVESLVADVTDRSQMSALADRTVESHGAIDVMVNNAGVMPLALYEDHVDAAEAWDRCIDINLKGVLHGIICVHDQMIRQGRGHIVNLSSVYGNHPVAGAAVYGATKAAVNVLSESLRQESQGRIKVTTIRPTGVPGTGLADGIVNPAALQGVLGAGVDKFMATIGRVFSDDPPPELIDPDRIEYFALSPELLADQIVFAIDQPWGVSISDLTVRASGDGYMI
ncbi:MAG: SDR family oxidoreductase [Myxococcales bacterium]|nr:SDR family oxidoreductase [Myxococcales bacterium]HIK86777.1 SDR family oxidoreductase [Myxococcales bacterium]